MTISNIGRIISEKDNFAIVAHTSPDGDSLGSTLGLYNFLKEINKSADIFLDGITPEKYNFLPGIREIKGVDDRKDIYDCLFVLDSGDPDRIGNCKKLISSSEVVINIDHHMTNTHFGTINLVDTRASSVGEMLFNVIKGNGFSISKNAAICLYTSIVTDTGGFKYSNTTATTMAIAGELMNSGIDFTEINRRAFDIKTIPQVKLMSKVASTLDITSKNRVAILYLTSRMLDECEAKEDDASDFINIARDIEGVEVAVFIKEINKNSSRISLRSKKYVDVSKIAEYFGGGGHIRASGCTLNGDINEARDTMLRKIESVMDGIFI